MPFSTIIVRSPLEMSALVSAIRGAVHEIDPDLPLFDVRRLENVLGEELVVFWIFGSMFAVFATAALALAGVGLYRGHMPIRLRRGPASSACAWRSEHARNISGGR